MRWHPIPPATAGLLMVAALVLAACGTSRITSSQTTLTSDDVGADVPIRVTSTRIKPSLLHLYNGVEVTFVNEDAVARRLAFDPARSDQAGCSAVAMVLQPGERRVSVSLPHFAACYFRDEQRPADAAFQGVIVTH